MKILIVEDDQRIATVLGEALQDQQYVVDVVGDGRSGLDYAEAGDYDAIILDVMLPEIDGITVCQTLRQRQMAVPILMLTARDASVDKVVGLDAGADDYVVKPFDLHELLARLRALLRRGKAPVVSVLRWGDLSLDLGTCTVTYGDRPLSLTPKEYALVELLLRHPTQTFSRTVILDRLCALDDDPPSEDAVKTLMRRLRQKLARAGAPSDLIETLYGFGYRLNASP
jgi:DNA-binding response OmpR family regulator